ncbi:MAG: hypothetical protein IKF90_06495, partial [Parasporobacterium sp.]|nr:hypothetical protein [Parasporobacterium sp.]
KYLALNQIQTTLCFFNYLLDGQHTNTKGFRDFFIHNMHFSGGGFGVVSQILFRDSPVTKTYRAGRKACSDIFTD